MKEHYVVTKVEKDGTKGKPFSLDIDSIVKLLKMTTPGRCGFLIERIV